MYAAMPNISMCGIPGLIVGVEKLMGYGFRERGFVGGSGFARTSFLFFSFPSYIIEVADGAGMRRVNLKPVYHNAEVVVPCSREQQRKVPDINSSIVSVLRPKVTWCGIRRRRVQLWRYVRFGYGRKSK